MPVTTLPEVAGFIAPGVTIVKWVPTIADITAPTSAELATGDDLTAQVVGGSGWTVTANNVPKPNLKKLFIGTIPGRTTAADSSLTYDQDEEGLDIRGTQTRGDAGFMVFCWGGAAEDHFIDIYPVRVSSVSPDVKFDESPASVTVGYSITSEPAQYVAWPAA